jgi:LysM repeat protein
MYSISQKYGIRLKRLYKLNKMSEDESTPEVGTILRLR